MKKVISVLLVLGMVFSLAACGNASNQNQAAESAAPAAQESGQEAPASGFTGKIAVVTNTVSQNEEEYRSAEQLVAKYGDQIYHVTWPDNFMTEQEQMVSIVGKIAGDPDIKALIINQAVPGTNAAVDKLLETRDDMFIVYYEPQENPPDVCARANLVLMPNVLAMGPVMIKQAKEMGAKTFVHYSFPRHMSQVLLSGRRDLMIETCKEEGIEFVDATAPDPTSEVGVPGAQQFILEDVPKMVAQYGEDTAFFSTNCAMQIPLIKSTVDTHAIYPSPCDPSPYHGFPAALGIETGDEMGDINYVIDETRRIAAENNMTGRLATWPVPASMMGTVAGAEYAIKWINGEVPKEGIDTAVLTSCMQDYIKETTGNAVSMELTAYEENGVTYDNFLMLLMGYFTY